MKINWYTAPPVPADVILRQAQGLPLGGQIINGPRGQQTFIPDRSDRQTRQIEARVSYAPGGGVYATAK